MFTVLLELDDAQVSMFREREEECRRLGWNFDGAPIHLRGLGYERDVITMKGHHDFLSLEAENRGFRYAVKGFTDAIEKAVGLRENNLEVVRESELSRFREGEARKELEEVRLKLDRLMGNGSAEHGAICAKCRHMRDYNCHHPENMVLDFVTGETSPSACKKCNGKGQCEVFASLDAFDLGE